MYRMQNVCIKFMCKIEAYYDKMCLNFLNIFFGFNINKRYYDMSSYSEPISRTLFVTRFLMVL